MTDPELQALALALLPIVFPDLAPPAPTESAPTMRPRLPGSGQSSPYGWRYARPAPIAASEAPAPGRGRAAGWPNLAALLSYWKP